MSSGGTARVLAIAGGAAALLLALLSYLSFRSALSARIDHVAALEAAAVRPAAAARLAGELAAHRLARVAGDETRAVAGAFRRSGGDAALEAYRKAGGSPSLLDEARRALAAAPDDPGGDVAFLRAFRGLRAEADAAPSPPRPEPPPSARKAGTLLLAAVGAAALTAFLAYGAGRSRAS